MIYIYKEFTHKGLVSTADKGKNYSVKTNKGLRIKEKIQYCKSLILINNMFLSLLHLTAENTISKPSFYVKVFSIFRL